MTMQRVENMEDEEFSLSSICTVKFTVIQEWFHDCYLTEIAQNFDV